MKIHGGGEVFLRRAPLMVFLAVVFLLLPMSVHADEWWDSSWDYRKNITIHHTLVNGTQVNFPVLVNLSDSDLASDAQENGDDVVFVDSTGVKLDHEIEFFNGSTGRLVAWVRVAALSNETDTTIWMYYGNSGASNQQNVTGVWDDNFVLVQHLEETDIDGGTGDIKDSTSNANNGTTSGMYTNASVAGQVDGSFDFDGTGNQYVDVGTGADFVSSQGTISFWMNLNSTANGGMLHLYQAAFSDFLHLYVSTSNSISLEIEEGNIDVVLVGYDLDNLGYAFLNTWVHVVWVQSGSGAEVYVDGINRTLSITTDDGSWTDAFSLADAKIGVTSWGEHDGTIDEVRISNTSRSAGWIHTEYNNQYSPSIFYSVGSEEAGDSTPPNVTSVSTSPNPQGLGENVTITATITDNFGVDTVLVGITPPGGSEVNYTMTNQSSTYTYNYLNYTNGTYLYTIYANDTNENLNNSENGTFELYSDVYLHVKTLKDSYGANEIVNITDPFEFDLSGFAAEEDEEVLGENNELEDTSVVSKLFSSVSSLFGNLYNEVFGITGRSVSAGDVSGESISAVEGIFKGDIITQEEGVYYVSPTGSASWSECTNISTPCSLSTAATNAVAGNIVNVAGGTYSGTISPSNPGTIGNPIVFEAESGVTLNGRFDINNRVYITVRGFNIVSSDGSSISLTNAHNTVIENNTIDTTWGNCIDFERLDPSNNVHIFGNTITGCGYGAVAIWMCGSNNLIENNDISDVTDDFTRVFGSRNVIRNNYFHDAVDTPDSHLDGTQTWCPLSFFITQYNLIENNYLTNIYGANTHWFVLQDENPSGCDIHDFILRYNRGDNVGSGFLISDNEVDHVKAYHNTINNHSAAFLTKPWATTAFAGGSDYGAFINNIIKDSVRPNAIVYYDVASYLQAHHNLAYLTECGTSCPWQNPMNSEVGGITNQNPLLNSDLSLQAGSPAIDFGGELTNVATVDSGSGTILVVNDAHFFQDGWAGVDPDWIAVGTVGNVVQISSIDYDTNTITLADSIIRSDSDSVWLYRDSDGTRVLYGDAPDIGAYEYIPQDPTPTRSNPQPNGTLSAGTTSTNISLTTDINATCRYSNTSDTNYTDMTGTFTNTNSTNHSTTVGPLSNGNTYIYYVRCNSTANGVYNDDDFPITFSVDGHEADTDNDGVIDMPELMALIARWKADPSDVTKSEVEEARGIWFGWAGIE